jgi:hypothetical protein
MNAGIIYPMRVNAVRMISFGCRVIASSAAGDETITLASGGGVLVRSNDGDRRVPEGMDTTKIAIARPEIRDPSPRISHWINWLRRKLQRCGTTNSVSPINEIRSACREREQRDRAPRLHLLFPPRKRGGQDERLHRGGSGGRNCMPPVGMGGAFRFTHSSNQVSRPLTLRVVVERSGFGRWVLSNRCGATWKHVALSETAAYTSDASCL